MEEKTGGQVGQPTSDERRNRGILSGLAQEYIQLTEAIPRLEQKLEYTKRQLARVAKDSEELLSKMPNPFQETLDRIGDQEPLTTRIAELEQEKERLQEEVNFLASNHPTAALKALLKVHADSVTHLSSYDIMLLPSERPVKIERHPIEFIDGDGNEPLYPQLFPETLLSDSHSTIAKMASIFAKTYPPEVLRHVSFEALQEDEGTTSYTMLIHAEPITFEVSPKEG